ncbi:MAG: hypothetical protein ACR2G6_01690 [Gemmatimonadaceae bacterium]
MAIVRLLLTIRSKLAPSGDNLLTFSGRIGIQGGDGKTLLPRGQIRHCIPGGGGETPHDIEAQKRKQAMAQATLKNQKTIIANDRAIIKNQRRILRNQDRLTLMLGNQARILRNQQAILKNQKKILANQARILAK